MNMVLAAVTTSGREPVDADELGHHLVAVLDERELAEIVADWVRREPVL